MRNVVARQVDRCQPPCGKRRRKCETQAGNRAGDRPVQVLEGAHQVAHLGSRDRAAFAAREFPVDGSGEAEVENRQPCLDRDEQAHQAIRLDTHQPDVDGNQDNADQAGPALANGIGEDVAPGFRCGGRHGAARGLVRPTPRESDC